MTFAIRPHPRTCDICDNNAERPFRVIWNASINERVSFCSRWCFVSYFENTVLPLENKKFVYEPKVRRKSA